MTGMNEPPKAYVKVSGDQVTSGGSAGRVSDASADLATTREQLARKSKELGDRIARYQGERLVINERIKATRAERDEIERVLRAFTPRKPRTRKGASGG